MSNAALLDLQSRINSNTLTVAQQSALSEALTAIIPDFPTPDEQSRSNGQVDQPLSRQWMAVLYAVQAEGVGPMDLPTNQIEWHINALTGNNGNDGTTSGKAIRSAAYLASLWRGTVGGGRPLLNPATGTTITIFLDSAIPDTDPLSVLLDVDMVEGMTLVFEGSATANHTGTMATASTYAQTSAGGQQLITDGSVADYSGFVGSHSLVVDTTTGGVGWLYGPFGSSSATGISSRMYTAQTAGVLSIPTVSDPAASDGYTLNDVTNCTLGNGFITRAFPGVAASPGLPPLVVFYRVHFVDTSSTLSELVSPTVPYFFQESQTDVRIALLNGQEASAVNCMGFEVDYISAGAESVFELFAGALQGNTSGRASGTAGGILVADGDFTLCSDEGYEASDGGVVELGNAARFCNGAPANSLFDCFDRGSVVLDSLQQGTHILYGVDGGTAFDATQDLSTVQYEGLAVNAFDTTNTSFVIGKGLTSCFSFKQADGTFVGPTTNTFAHLDAAQAAGTGFGGSAVDPASGCIVATLS